MDELRALIRSHRPNNAAAYSLRGNAGRFPRSGGWTFDPFVPPICPAGSYTLAFLASEAHNVPLPPAMHEMAHPIIQLPDMSKTALVKSKERAVVIKEDPLVRLDHIVETPLKWAWAETGWQQRGQRVIQRRRMACSRRATSASVQWTGSLVRELSALREGLGAALRDVLICTRRFFWRGFGSLHAIGERLLFALILCALLYQESVRERAQRQVMMQPIPRATLEVIQTHLRFHLLVVALDAPAQLGEVHKTLKRSRLGQRTEPVMRGEFLLRRPLPNQPLLRFRSHSFAVSSRGLHAHRGEQSPSLGSVSVSPRHFG